jgi:hypothetical protein
MEADTTTSSAPRLTAYDVNLHLAKGGQVLVSTYTRATLYKRRHAGWFQERDGALHVRHGKGWNRLSNTGARAALLVGIRFC